MYRVNFNMNTQIPDADPVPVGETSDEAKVVDIIQADYQKRFAKTDGAWDGLYSVRYDSDPSDPYSDSWEVYPQNETATKWSE